jgi:hypothetical protein
MKHRRQKSSRSGGSSLRFSTRTSTASSTTDMAPRTLTISPGPRKLRSARPMTMFPAQNTQARFSHR